MEKPHGKKKHVGLFFRWIVKVMRKKLANNCLLDFTRMLMMFL